MANRTFIAPVLLNYRRFNATTMLRFAVTRLPPDAHRNSSVDWMLIELAKAPENPVELTSVQMLLSESFTETPNETVKLPVGVTEPVSVPD